jgi:stage II sporulation protein D
MRSAALIAAGVVVTASVLAHGPAGAVSTDQSTDQSYWAPADGQVTVRGHGYGHGHGMSQYGAQGAALQGLDHRDILGFYYPGTAWSTMRGKVRVLITADTTDDVVVTPVEGLSVRDLGDGSVHPLPGREDVSRWRLDVRDGRTVVEMLTDRWRAFRAPWVATIAGDGEFFADGPLTLWTPSGSRAYRGTLRAVSSTPGSPSRDTVNVVSMNQYVMGVVPHEMPASWHPEAVKAQAVAARTYGTWSRNQNFKRYYQICDTTACQVYGGMDAEDPRSNAAVRATGRRVLTYDGKPAFTQFSASSGGWTSAGSVPYLPAKEDPYDAWSGNGVHSWTLQVDLARLERSYPALGRLRRIDVVSRDGYGEWRGRVRSMVLDGTKSDVTITGDTFRWTFGLRSSWFTIEPTPIIARWSNIGGPRSRVGDVRSAEVRVASGAAQRFERGRIFHSRDTGARELYGIVLGTYNRAGGPASELGFPRTPVRRRPAGRFAHFQGGSVFVKDPRAAVVLTGATARRFRAEGTLRSGLGWPTRSTYDVAGGERTDFEKGHIRWDRRSDTTEVVLER